ncbi:GyrI-like domain-containing protein [uncultured Croceitalea sp.]|uniref:GyrI-like domain-containing protein n=1 Tax=uncultured Croceitalea sp. TaxID=1798908 RepID=UPI0033056C84
MKKKVLLSTLLLLALGLSWYLFVKPYDYTVRFEAKTFPGAINQALKLWDQTLEPIEQIQQNESLYQLKQKLKFGDSLYVYDWKIKPLTDSTSKVRINIQDVNHSLMNKIKVPFSDTDFEKRSRKTVLDFMENLNDHIDAFKVKIDGKAEIPSKYVAYIPIKSSQFKKAGGMMKNTTYIEQTLMQNGVQLDGPPMVEVIEWNRSVDSLEYNFCYPIIKSDSLPMNTDLKYKSILPKNALKATYNGNYITSDRAWYKLMDYASKKNIELEPTPVEAFYNNPNFGGNELNWKAEIYMPIKEDLSE